MTLDLQRQGAEFNLHRYIHGIGKRMLFEAPAGESVLLERIVAVAAIAGTVRLTSHSGLLKYWLSFFKWLMVLWPGDG